MRVASEESSVKYLVRLFCCINTTVPAFPERNRFAPQFRENPGIGFTLSLPETRKYTHTGEANEIYILVYENW
jgi:hypothetical protein